MPFVRAHLRAWLHHHRWPGDARDDIVPVVNELVSNAIEHAYPLQRVGPVDVTTAVRPAGPASGRFTSRSSTTATGGSPPRTATTTAFRWWPR